MFEIKSVKSVKKDLKKLPHEVMRDIENIHFKNIREDPFPAPPLKGPFQHQNGGLQPQNDAIFK